MKDIDYSLSKEQLTCVYMCRAVNDDFQQLKDLLIYWTSPQQHPISPLSFLRPGVYLSKLAVFGLNLPKLFWQSLRSDGVATCHFRLIDSNCNLQVFATDQNYVLTLTCLPLTDSLKKAKMEALQNAIVQYAGIGIALTNTEGTIRMVNPALEKMTGYTANELVDKLTPADLRVPAILNQQIKELLPEVPEGTEGVDNTVRAYLDTHDVLQRENTLLKKNGEHLPVLSTSTKLYDKENNFVGYVDFVADISELKQTQKELFLANQRLQLATKAGKIGIWQFNLLTNEFTWDEETYRIHGIPLKTKITFQTLLNLIHPEDLYLVLQAMEKTEFENSLLRIIRPDGRVRYLQSHVIKVPSSNGFFNDTIGVVTDVTENHLTQIALSESEKRYRFLVNNLKEVVFQTNLAGDWTFLNQSWTEITGFDVESTLGISCLEFVHPDDRERNLSYILELVHQKKDYCRHEVRYLCQDGSYRWIEVFAKLSFDENGTPTGTIGTLYDISDRKKMETELSNSEKRFKAIFNSTYQFIGLTEPNGTILESNQTALEAAGVSREDVIGKPFWETYWWQICPLTQQRVQESFAQAAQGQHIRYEVDVWAKNQTVITIDFSITPITDHEGKVILLLPEGHNITEIKRARAALMESEERFREIAENVDEIFWIRDIYEAKFTYINATYERLTGRSRQSLYDNPKSFLDFIAQEDQIALMRLFNSNHDQDTTLEFRGIIKDGSIRWFVGRIFIIKNEKGVIQRRIGIASDITLQKEKELLLTKTLQKEIDLNHLKSQFVSFVSHEFRTPLTTILTSVELMEHYLFNTQKEQLNPEIAPRIKHHISTIQNKINFFNDLLTDTLTLNQIEAGKISFNPLPTNLTAFIESVIFEFFNDRPDGRKVEFEVMGEPESVSIDEKLIRRVLINLFSNAFKFSTTNPTLRLSFEEKVAKIDVIDEGIGIPAEDIPKLFTTFFRAGNAEKIAGTGLGLQISKQLVELHGGEIRVHSQQNKGTQITILLPKS